MNEDHTSTPTLRHFPFQWLLIGYKTLAIFAKTSLWKIFASYWRQQIPLGSVIWWNITKSLYTYIYICKYIHTYRWWLNQLDAKNCSSHWIIVPAAKAEKLKPSPIFLYLHVHTLHDTCIYKLSTISEDAHETFLSFHWLGNLSIFIFLSVFSMSSFALLSAFDFHSQNTKIIWDHPPSMVHPAWLEAEQQKLAVKHMGRFHRDEISVAEVFLWNACLVNIHEYWVLPCWLRLVVSCNDKVSTTNHLKPLADVCHG